MVVLFSMQKLSVLRDDDVNGCPVLQRTFKFYLPSVRPAGLFYIKQPESKAFNIVNIPGWYAEELSEHFIMVFRADARPGIGYLQDCFPFITSG
jgi:hypothetical protein